MFESTQIIGTHQFNKAVELFEGAVTPLVGPIDYIHTYVDMSNVTVDASYTSTGETGVTCRGSLGDRYRSHLKSRRNFQLCSRNY